MPRNPRNPDDKEFLRTFSDKESDFDRAIQGDATLRHIGVTIDRAKDALDKPNPFGMSKPVAEQVIADGTAMVAHRKAYLEPIWEEAVGNEQLFSHLVEVYDTAAYAAAASQETRLTFLALHEQAIERLVGYQQSSGPS